MKTIKKSKSKLNLSNNLKPITKEILNKRLNHGKIKDKLKVKAKTGVGKKIVNKIKNKDKQKAPGKIKIHKKEHLKNRNHGEKAKIKLNKAIQAGKENKPRLKKLNQQKNLLKIMKKKLENNNGINNKRFKVQNSKNPVRSKTPKARKEVDSKIKIIGKVATINNKIATEVESKDILMQRDMDINKLKAKNFDCCNENKLYLIGSKII